MILKYIYLFIVECIIFFFLQIIHKIYSYSVTVMCVYNITTSIVRIGLL